MNAVRLLSPAHTRSPMWVMWKVFIYCLLWLVEYQCKGVVKFNLSDLFFWGHFQRSWTSWQIVDFMFTFEDFWFLEGLSIKRKLLSCTNGVHFIEIPLWVLKDTLNTTKDSRHPWRTHIGVKGSDRGPFILILDLILVHAT